MRWPLIIVASVLSIKEELERIYAEYGRYLNKVNSYEVPGLSGMETMAGIMSRLRENPPKEFAGYPVVKVTDYKSRRRRPARCQCADLCPGGWRHRGGASFRYRTKIKTYFTTLGKDLAEAEAQQKALAAAVEPMLK